MLIVTFGELNSYLVHWLFIDCSLIVHWLFIDCSLITNTIFALNMWLHIYRYYFIWQIFYISFLVIFSVFVMTELRPFSTSYGTTNNNCTDLSQCITCCLSSYTSVGCLEIATYAFFLDHFLNEIRQVQWISDSIGCPLPDSCHSFNQSKWSDVTPW